MIVTRQRKKKRNHAKLLLPLVAIAALAVALGWPPSRNVIANGPLKPAFGTAANALGVVARPLTFAGQQQTITDRNREIRRLDTDLEKARKDKADDDARVAALRQQLDALAAQPKPTAAPAARRSAAPSSGAVAGASAPAAGPAAATEEEKRTAATWAAMEPEKAAAVVQRLPDDRVIRVLAAMDAESAAGILNALPPAVAARLSRASAQVSPVANR